jgi:hypothetical protein
LNAETGKTSAGTGGVGTEELLNTPVGLAFVTVENNPVLPVAAGAKNVNPSVE